MRVQNKKMFDNELQKWQDLKTEHQINKALAEKKQDDSKVKLYDLLIKITDNYINELIVVGRNQLKLNV